MGARRADAGVRGDDPAVPVVAVARGHRHAPHRACRIPRAGVACGEEAEPLGAVGAGGAQGAHLVVARGALVHLHEHLVAGAGVAGRAVQPCRAGFRPPLCTPRRTHSRDTVGRVGRAGALEVLAHLAGGASLVGDGSLVGARQALHAGAKVGEVESGVAEAVALRLGPAAGGDRVRHARLAQRALVLVLVGPAGAGHADVPLVKRARGHPELLVIVVLEVHPNLVVLARRARNARRGHLHVPRKAVVHGEPARPPEVPTRVAHVVGDAFSRGGCPLNLGHHSKVTVGASVVKVRAPISEVAQVTVIGGPLQRPIKRPVSLPVARYAPAPLGIRRDALCGAMGRAVDACCHPDLVGIAPLGAGCADRRGVHVVALIADTGLRAHAIVLACRRVDAEGVRPDPVVLKARRAAPTLHATAANQVVIVQALPICVFEARRELYDVGVAANEVGAIRNRHARARLAGGHHRVAARFVVLPQGARASFAGAGGGPTTRRDVLALFAVVAGLATLVVVLESPADHHLALRVLITSAHGSLHRAGLAGTAWSARGTVGVPGGEKGVTDTVHLDGDGRAGLDQRPQHLPRADVAVRWAHALQTYHQGVQL
eukprot:767463-Hanusia_phi.AAC.4